MLRVVLLLRTEPPFCSELEFRGTLQMAGSSNKHLQHGKWVMEELIKQLTDKLGVDSSIASAATGKAMAMIKDQAGGDLFSQISGAIPGAEEAAQAGAEETGEAAGGGGGMLGSLASMASSALGGSAGDALGMASKLSDAGLEASQMGGFAETIIAFLKDKVGDEILDQILAKVPMLKGLIG